MHCRLPPPRARRTVHWHPLRGKGAVSKGFGYTGRLFAPGVSGDRGALAACTCRLSRNHAALGTSWPGRVWICAFHRASRRRVRQRPDARFLAAGVVHGQRRAPGLGPQEVSFPGPRGLREGKGPRRQAALPALQPGLPSGGAGRGQRLGVFMELGQPVRSCGYCLLVFGLLFLLLFP